MAEIQKVAVIGAGVMGAGIAAQVANAGFDVVLLDIVPEGAEDRSIIAKTAVQKMLKAKPAAFMHKRNAKRVTTGNIEDDLELLRDCDWVIEAIIERLDLKQDLYKKIEKYRKKGATISSNTSTIPLDDLTEGFSDTFKKNFLITHFFNPPRYLRLLELVTSKHTSKDVYDRIAHFADYHLGKSIVDCKDSPGFIANRIGTFWIHSAITNAVALDIDVETADKVMSKPIGVPKTGVFGLVDLVGLDLMPHIFDSFQKTLKKDDPFIVMGEAPQFMSEMIESGYTGRKGKGGFYRLNKEAGKKVKEVKNLKTGDYYTATRPKVDAADVVKKKGLSAMISHPSKAGNYAWEVLSGTLCYAANLVGEIANNIEQIDRAMRLGYNWKFGPFELIDKIGTKTFVSMLNAHNIAVPKILEVAGDRKLYRTYQGKLQYLDLSGDYKEVLRPEGVMLLEDVKRLGPPVAKNISASLWDIGDGVLCLEFTSKMNSMNPFILSMMGKAKKLIENNPQYKGLVIHNEGTNFSVGANIGLLLVAMKLHLWAFVTWILKKGQFAYRDLKFANFPVVGAPSGMALGGGCEILLHCDEVTPHAETYIGLVEVGVGIIPGWGGCKEMLVRANHAPKFNKGPMPATMHAFQHIATAQVATSAFEAKDSLFFKHSDQIVMNKDRLLATAKARVLELAKNYKAPEEAVIKLPGAPGAAALMLGVNDFAKKGIATPHDVTIAAELSKVLSGYDVDMNDEVTESDILKFERTAFLKLCKKKESQARVQHMLTKGKPLRN